MEPEITIRQSLFDTDKEFEQLVELQNEVYRERGLHFTVNSFKKWYLDNPNGKVLSFNAFDGEKMVAHYACIPFKMYIEERIIKGLLDISTVTHPNYRRMGLFKKLAQTTFDYGKKDDYKFVLGVANDNSFPGYMKHFPFSNIGQLDVKIGFGNKIYCDTKKTYRVFWDVNSFNWRLNTGCANYSRNGNSIFGKYNSIVHTYMGYYQDSFLSKTNIQDKHWGWRPKLYIGMGAKFDSIYINVPKFIKHSPFNLIFLDLTEGKLPPMTKDNIFFQLFDFDVA